PRVSAQGESGHIHGGALAFFLFHDHLVASRKPFIPLAPLRARRHPRVASKASLWHEGARMLGETSRRIVASPCGEGRPSLQTGGRTERHGLSSAIADAQVNGRQAS